MLSLFPISRLNTFLELKIENERLQQRLAELRVRTASPTVPPPGNPVQGGYLYGASNARMGIADMSGSYHHHHLTKVVYDDTMQQTAHQTRNVGYDPQGTHSFRAQYTSSSGVEPEDDAGDDTSRRKKVADDLTTVYVC